VLGIVLKLLVVEEDLLACCKNEIGAAVNTLQDSIGEFHGRLPSQGMHPKSATALKKLAGPGSLSSFVLRFKGPDRTQNMAVRELYPGKPGGLATPRASRAPSELSRFSGSCTELQLRAKWLSRGAHAKGLLRIRSTETGEML
jgi:hypothetical protein